ncbi:MAG: hypothetical protein H6727_21225 [Myxococcales bacterium]|nr:hypothetical protein [Myxococcales bacterium]
MPTSNKFAGQIPLSLHQDPWLVMAPGIFCVPCLHYCVEFADIVRRAVAWLQPDAIAVELPPTLAPALRQAISHLPALSVLFYHNQEDQPLYLQVEPTDALIEAVRSGMEKQIPLHFVDIDVDYVHQHQDPLPDPYACLRLGLRAYCEQVMESMEDLPKTPEDRRREQAMAYHLQVLQKQHKRILFVVGMAHYEGIQQELKTPQPMPFARRHRDDVRVFNLHPDAVREIAVEMPFLIATYELRRHALPPKPPPRLHKHGPRFERFELLQGGRQLQPEQLRWDALYAAARQAHGTAQTTRKLPLHLLPLERVQVQLSLLKEAARWYQSHTGEVASKDQLSVLRDFSARYAAIDQRLVPDLFQLLTASRFCVDDDFCYEVWDLATTYPWQEHSSFLPMVEVDDDDHEDDDERQRLLSRLLQQRQRTTRRLAIRPRPTERFPGEWRRQFSGTTIFSYPPEEMALEGYSRSLRQSAQQRLMQERSRVVPFRASLLDGIDLHETMRHWHEKKIFVREFCRVPGGIGNVVLIFDEDLEDKRYPYRAAWLGEPPRESDMAFYGTLPDEKVIGPGISRCEYGGVLLTKPAGRLFDVWSDPDYRLARSKAEVLLLAALDYAVEPYVVYVAPKPCRAWFHTIAARMQLRILHIPLRELDPTTLKKMRIFHILDSIERREIAKQYIYS